MPYQLIFWISAIATAIIITFTAGFDFRVQIFSMILALLTEPITFIVGIGLSMVGKDYKTFMKWCVPIALAYSIIYSGIMSLPNSPFPKYKFYFFIYQFIGIVLLANTINIFRFFLKKRRELEDRAIDTP